MVTMSTIIYDSSIGRYYLNPQPSLNPQDNIFRVSPSSRSPLTTCECQPSHMHVSMAIMNSCRLAGGATCIPQTEVRFLCVCGPRDYRIRELAYTLCIIES